MSGTLPINSVRLRQRLLDLGVSDRAVAARTGLGQSAVRAMTTTGRVSDSISLSSIRRIMDLTGLSAQQLLDPPDATPWGAQALPPTDQQRTPDTKSGHADGEELAEDVAVLAQTLLSDLRMHSIDRLATALCWTFDRLHAAIRALDVDLRVVGLRTHRNAMGVTLRAVDSRAEDHSRRLATLRDADDGLNHGEARTLFDIVTESFSKTDVDQATNVWLRQLHNRGLIHFGGITGSRTAVTGDVAYAFAIPMTGGCTTDETTTGTSTAAPVPSSATTKPTGMPRQRPRLVD